MDARNIIANSLFKALDETGEYVEKQGDEIDCVCVDGHFDLGELSSAILAALKEAGMVIVPGEPSDDMTAAATMDGLRSARNGDRLDKQIGVIWSAMLAAAQEQEAE
jgi:hypothetical protein